MSLVSAQGQLLKPHSPIQPKPPHSPIFKILKSPPDAVEGCKGHRLKIMMIFSTLRIKEKRFTCEPNLELSKILKGKTLRNKITGMKTMAGMTIKLDTTMLNKGHQNSR